jgi:hypothetical protein
MDSEAGSLAYVAEASGFSVSDVAYLAGLEKSTVSRLWDDPAWLDRVSGSSLQALIRVVPGVAEHLCRHSLQIRRADLVEALVGAGLTVDQDVFRRLVETERVPEQYLGNALEAALKIMHGDIPGTAAHLMRFWGRGQDYALGFLLDTTLGKGLVANPAPLVEASSDMIDRLAGRTSSFHAIVAQATLTHHVAKTHGTFLGQPTPGQHQTAFAFRSGMVGMIIQTNDLDLAKHYGRVVQDTHLLGLVEDWSFPTYMRDAQVTRDFSLPRSLLLRHTAEEVVRELASYNDAYVYYLATVYLPRSLRRDPTFGLRLPYLVAGIKSRRDLTQEPDVQDACDEFLKLVT